MTRRRVPVIDPHDGIDGEHPPTIRRTNGTLKFVPFVGSDVCEGPAPYARALVVSAWHRIPRPILARVARLHLMGRASFSGYGVSAQEGRQRK